MTSTLSKKVVAISAASAWPKTFSRLCHSAAANAGSPSALFVPNSYGAKTTPTVIPHFDLTNLDVDAMQSNLEARRIAFDAVPGKFSSLSLESSASKSPNLETLVKAGCDLRDLEVTLLDISGKLQGLRDKIKAADEITHQTNDVASDEKDEFSALKELEKNLKAQRDHIEENFVLKYLDLPNVLHPDTPLSQPVVLHQQPGSTQVSETQMKSHAKLCSDQLTFTDHGVYLEGDLAMMELNLSASAQQILDDLGYEMMSGPDFARSVILEGCAPGADVVGSGGTSHAFPMAKVKEIGGHETGMGLHLVGSASLYPFVAQLVKHVVISPNVAPIRQFTVGRRYKPTNVQSSAKSLFQVPQTTCVQVFTASLDRHQMELQLDEMVEAAKGFYDKLGLPYQIKIASAPELARAESKKLVVTVPAVGTTPSGEGEVVVGEFSLYDDFISNRLMTLYVSEQQQVGTQGSTDKYSGFHIAAGTLVDVTKLIGCVVEQFPNDWNDRVDSMF